MSKISKSLTSKTICITGAASGIGRALAAALAAEGARLLLIDIDEFSLEEARDACCQLGCEAHAALCDVSDLTAMRLMRQKLPAAFSSIDIIIANAGISQITQVENFNAEQNQQIIAVNYSGTVNIVSLFLSDMVRRRDGHIVGISSLAGYRGLPGSACYGASKAAQAVFLEGLRVDLRQHGVRVSTVFPGFVDTPINAPLHNLYHLPHMLTAEKAAQHIIRGLRRRRTKISFPLPSVLMGWVAIRLSNRTYDFLMRLNPYKKKPLNAAASTQPPVEIPPNDRGERLEQDPSYRR